jgi:hypothetical protein
MLRQGETFCDTLKHVLLDFSSSFNTSQTQGLPSVTIYNESNIHGCKQKFAD